MSLPLTHTHTNTTNQVSTTLQAGNGIGIHYEQIGDSFEYKRVIGEGGSAYVVLSSERSSGRLVAIKTVKEPIKTDPSHYHEVNFYLQAGSHPNIVELENIFVDVFSHHMSLVMENMDFDLHRVLYAREGEPLTPRALADISIQVASGLEFIHSRGFIHKDLKPQNILISNRNNDMLVKIADFGLSMCENSTPHLNNGPVGSMWYRSPEMLICRDSHSKAIDIWAYAVLIAEAANIKPLFPGTDGNYREMIQMMCLVVGQPSCYASGGPWSIPRHAAIPELDYTTLFGMCRSSLNPVIQNPQHKVYAKTLRACLRWDPKNRPSAKQVLQRVVECGRLASLQVTCPPVTVHSAPYTS